MTSMLFDVSKGIDVVPKVLGSKPVNAGELLATPPAKQQYVIDGFLPEPIVAAISSPGGLGKSHLLLAIGAAVAGGGTFLGHKVTKPGGVLYISAEDDQEEIKRRIWALNESLVENTEHDREAFERNLKIWSTVGEDNRLLQDDGQGKTWTDALWKFIAEAKSMNGLRLIILDPISRFRTGDENNSEDATRFVEALELIKKETGVTVLVAHHTRKNATGDTSDSIRGSSALVDALRFAATLSNIPPDQMTKYGLSEIERRNLIRLNVVKSNYKVEVSEIWVKRSSTGILSLTEPPVKRKAGPAPKSTCKDAKMLVDFLRKEAQQSIFYSEAQLRSMCGKKNTLGISTRVLAKIVSDLTSSGELKKQRKGKNMHLVFSGEK